ncbi:Hypothetical protein FKW44_012839 [Caligus rogercresseyi]|uniref:Uncharacterized protein n=1 Tax=Caligus rogercresseyi TaxID=217165 RepID=A0A7T8HJY2_CALRO|nr:Hypothetical protein FKW44_012839 [Caligus rogercresseyi]
MKTACVARNTVKSIRSELEESNNDYEKVVERKKGGKDVLTSSRPGIGKKLQEGAGGPQQVLHQAGGGVGGREHHS